MHLFCLCSFYFAYFGCSFAKAAVFLGGRGIIDSTSQQPAAGTSLSAPPWWIQILAFTKGRFPWPPGVSPTGILAF
jgi:hypothetical protein